MTVDYELRGHVAVMTINRPDARNAVNTAVAQGLEAAIDQLEADDEAWVGIITGAQTEKGWIFCAGADLKQMSTDPGGMMTPKGGFAGFVQRERSKPVIAAVDGPALAGGTGEPGNDEQNRKVADRIRSMIYRGVNGTTRFIRDEQAAYTFPTQTKDPSLGMPHEYLQIQDFTKDASLVAPDPYTAAKFMMPPWIKS